MAIDSATNARSPDRAMSFSRPPVWEVGFSISTALPNVLDPMQVNAVYEQFAHDLPVVQRNPPISGLELASTLGAADSHLHLLPGMPPRWWFASSDGSRILQLQEGFLAYNWRRWNVPAGERVEYPGFEVILKEAGDATKKLTSWQEENGRVPAEPRACELFYDNLVPVVSSDGSPLRLSDLLTDYAQDVEPRSRAMWQTSWQEKIDGLEVDDTSTFLVQLQQALLPNSDGTELTQLIKVTFTAAAIRTDWVAVEQFYRTAHDHIRSRFLELFTDRARDMWRAE